MLGEAFFELITAAALAIPTVLGMLGIVKASSEKQGLLVRGLGVTFLVLVGTLLVSAALRMGLYVQTYGLTELRLYTSSAMGWLGGAILILGYLVLRERHGRAGTWLVATAMVSVFVTTLINPDRTIAVVNLTRPADSMTVDTDYLLGLGSGVVEPLFAASEKELSWKGENLRAKLMKKYGSRGDLRSWTVSKEVARATLQR